LDTLVRDYWGHYDASAIAQLAPLAGETCYQPKIYKAPDSAKEVFSANAAKTTGLQITPGSIIYGFYLPALFSTLQAPQFAVQITDTSLNHDWFDEFIPSYFLANCKPTYLSALDELFGSFPNLIEAPYPVVCTGLFKVQIRETSGSSQRIQLCF